MMEKQSSSGGCFSFTRIEEVIYTAGGYDGSIRIDTTVDATGFNRGMSSFSGGLAKLKGTLKTVGTAIAGAFVPLTIAAATLELVKFGQEGVRASTELTNAMMGLQSIIEGQGRSFQKAKGFLDEYVSDGLIPMTNAVTSYKNLAARGYDDSQIQSVMTALKDASAYSRQSSYSMGEAVQTATEGLKNENSVLVDNAGVTKNVAKMWDDYAKSIGTTAKELTQQQKIQAEVNGIMEETRFQTGDAAKVAGSFSGQLAQLSYHFNELKVAVGDTLIPLLKAVLPLIDDIVQGLTWVFQKLSLVTQAITGQSADMVQGAGDASDAENDLANSINNASNAAKKALANFDDLNILQLGLNSNSGGFEFGSDDVKTVGGLNNALGSASLQFGDFNDKVAIAKNNLDNFTTSLELVKEAALQPIQIPAPIVGKLPDPVYDPNWGLDTPPIQLPAIPRLPPQIFQPNWGLDVPPIVLPTFPMLPNPVYSPVWGLVTSLTPEFSTATELVNAFVTDYQTAVSNASTTIPVLAADLNAAKQAVIGWGNYVLQVGYQTASGFVSNMQAMAQGAYVSTASFLTSSAQVLVQWGNHVLQVAAQTASGFTANIQGGLASAWGSISSLVGAIGGAVGGFFEKHGKTIAVVGAITIGGLAIASALPSGGSSLGALIPGLALIPRLADGAVIPPNKRFLAMLGDQTHGTNIETPLSTMVDAFNAALDARGGASGPIEVTVRIIADSKLTRALKTELDNESRRRGVKLVTGGAY